MVIGTRLGPYEILAKLGEGGMGEVYRARDTRLARSVAIKVLPPDAAADASARARFEREARAIAALSHPHICVVHDVGHQDGIDYLVMELLDGETLAERLARARGPLPLDEVLRIGVAIADALDKAHRAGIVHRDLKPLNVMLTKSGPKLLDFGLAKLHEASPVSLSDGTAATTVAPGTAHGTILGTIHYMAPEQVEGRPADTRSDIWALGAVLYEMATGQRPFDGESAASVVGAIMQGTPVPLATRQPLTPPAFEHLVERCLAKDPDERWQHAGDVRRELAWVANTSAGAPAVHVSDARTQTSARRAWAVAVLAVLCAVGALGAAVLYVRSRDASDVTTTWLTIPPPAGRFGERIEVSVSPDGRQVAFFAPDTDGTMRLFIRSLDSPTARVVDGTDGVVPGSGAPAWAPDGKALAVFARGKLLRVDVAGGTPQVLADAPGTARGASWNAEGTIILVPSAAAGLYRVSATGGQAVPVSLGRFDALVQYPAFLPDGRHFLFETTRGAGGEDAGIWSASLDGGDIQRVSPLVSSVAYARGHLFFGQRGSLFAQPFDAGRMLLSGEPVRVADGLGSSGGSAEHFAFSVAEQGPIVFANTLYSPRSQLAWYSRAGVASGVAGEVGEIMGFGLSPDHSRVGVEQLNLETSTLDLWLVDVASGTPVLFAPTGQQPQWVRTSPDHILFRRGNGLMRGTIQSGSVETLAIGGLPARPNLMDVSPDGQSLLVRIDQPKTLADLWTVPLAHAGDAKPFLATSASEFAGRFSPDGRWVAYSSDESGRSEIYVQAYPGGGAKVRVSQAGGGLPEWAPNGKELYYIAPDNQVMASIIAAGASTLSATAPVALFRAPALGGANSATQYRREYAAVDDGQRFLFNAVIPEKIPPTITVIQNWQPPTRP